jgi:NADP-dependent 3-hydroxy acid dehydrogenase YdfG
MINKTLKNIIITGASSGSGLSISKLFINKGWNVIGLARTEANLQLVRDELGINFNFYTVDISKSESVKKVFDAIYSAFGLIDVLVNNAGVFEMKPFLDSSIENIDRIIDINLKGTIYCTFNAIKFLKPKIGRVINIGSVAGEHGIKNQSIYSATKFGINGFADSLNQELLESGISLSNICPGGVNTPLWNEKNQYPDKDKSKILRGNDIANMVEYIVNQPSNVVIKKVVVFPINEWH